MPRYEYTQDDINNEIEEARKNQTEEKTLAQRLAERANAVGSSETLANNDELTYTLKDSLLISNNKDIKTVVQANPDREVYDVESIAGKLDLEIVELKSKAPPPEQEKQVPPTALQIAAANWHWAMPGKGVQEMGTGDWHHNWFPNGNNPGGGYLYIVDDHALFYIRGLEPIDKRRSFNYKWYMDGDIVSTKPYLMLYNLTCPKDADGAEIRNWRKAPDVKLTCEVSNAVGSTKVTVKYRVARGIGHQDYKDENDNFEPRQKYTGYYEWVEDDFYSGKKNVTRFVLTNRDLRTRHFRIKDIQFEDYKLHFFNQTDQHYKYNRIQNPDRLESKYYNGKGTDWNQNRRQLAQEWEDNHDISNIPKLSRFLNPYGDPNNDNPNEDYKWMDSGMVMGYNDDQAEINPSQFWVPFVDFWSGYGVDDPYDARNFYKRSGASTNQMDVHDKYIDFYASPGDSIKFAFKYMYRDNTFSDFSDVICYWVYFQKEVTEEDDLYNEVTLKAQLERYKHPAKEEPFSQEFSDSITEPSSIDYEGDDVNDSAWTGIQDDEGGGFFSQMSALRQQNQQMTNNEEDY